MKVDPLTNTAPEPLSLSTPLEIKEMGCGPAQHAFQTIGGVWSGGSAIFCTKCGDIRQLPSKEERP